MKIYSWNVNGIRAVHTKGALDNFLKQHDPDILCLQETKAQREQTTLDLPQYREYWCSAERKGYSGTAIWSKAAALNHTCGFPAHISKQFALHDTYGDLEKEGRVIACEFPEFFVVSVYTPNAKEDLSRLPIRQVWDEAFQAYMKELDAKKPVMYCGDLNVAHTEDDLAHPKENKGKHGFTDEERAGITAQLAAGFADTFRIFTQGNGHYSWWSHWGNARARNVGWRIDYIIASKRMMSRIKKSEIHADVLGSDHCPVSIEIE